MNAEEEGSKKGGLRELNKRERMLDREEENGEEGRLEISEVWESKRA